MGSDHGNLLNIGLGGTLLTNVTDPTPHPIKDFILSIKAQFPTESVLSCMLMLAHLTSVIVPFFPLKQISWIRPEKLLQGHSLGTNKHDTGLGIEFQEFRDSFWVFGIS
jgi:hypothetical protein